MAVNGGAGDDGAPLSELESLQLKANQVTDESLDSTRRMIQLCEDVSANATTLCISSRLAEVAIWDIWGYFLSLPLSPLLSLAFMQSKEAGIKTLVALDDQGGK